MTLPSQPIAPEFIYNLQSLIDFVGYGIVRLPVPVQHFWEASSLEREIKFLFVKTPSLRGIHGDFSDNYLAQWKFRVYGGATRAKQFSQAEIRSAGNNRVRFSALYLVSVVIFDSIDHYYWTNPKFRMPAWFEWSQCIYRDVTRIMWVSSSVESSWRR